MEATNMGSKDVTKTAGETSTSMDIKIQSEVEKIWINYDAD